MKILVLEDDPERIKWFQSHLKSHGSLITTNAQTAIGALKAFDYDLIFLDHDLGGKAFVSSDDPETGYQVALYLSQTGSFGENVIIHSLNAVGAANMHQILPSAKVIPFFNLPMFWGDLLSGGKNGEDNC